MVYRCVMRQSRIFYMEADSDDNAIDWVQTHSLQDVDNLTKEYRDEFDESVYLPDNQEDLKPHFSITKEKSEKESEDEFMNESMTRLKALIDESNKIMDDVKAETKRLEEEHTANLEEKFEKFKSKMKEYAEVLGSVCNLGIDSGLRFENDRGYYVFYISKEKSDMIIRGDNDYYIGDVRFNLNRDAHIRGKFISAYDIDRIIDNFNPDAFEENMVKAVQEMLVKNAEVTDANYQNAKSKLEKDNQDR